MHWPIHDPIEVFDGRLIRNTCWLQVSDGWPCIGQSMAPADFEYLMDGLFVARAGHKHEIRSVSA